MAEFFLLLMFIGAVIIIGLIFSLFLSIYRKEISKDEIIHSLIVLFGEVLLWRI